MLYNRHSKNVYILLISKSYHFMRANSMIAHQNIITLKILRLIKNKFDY